jgi:hypothetical protein
MATKGTATSVTGSPVATITKPTQTGPWTAPGSGSKGGPWTKPGK